MAVVCDSGRLLRPLVAVDVVVVGQLGDPSKEAALQVEATFVRDNLVDVFIEVKLSTIASTLLGCLITNQSPRTPTFR